jgi:hypothetical protein
MHPILITALAEDRRCRCPCGAVTQQSYDLCRECRAVAIWRRETAQRSRSAPDASHPGTAKTPLFARVASLLQITSKGAES